MITINGSGAESRRDYMSNLLAKYGKLVDNFFFLFCCHVPTLHGSGHVQNSERMISAQRSLALWVVI